MVKVIVLVANIAFGFVHWFLRLSNCCIPVGECFIGCVQVFVLDAIAFFDLLHALLHRIVLMSDVAQCFIPQCCCVFSCSLNHIAWRRFFLIRYRRHRVVQSCLWSRIARGGLTCIWIIINFTFAEFI